MKAPTAKGMDYNYKQIKDVPVYWLLLLLGPNAVRRSR